MQRPPQANVIYQFPKKTGAGRLSECSGLKCLKRLSCIQIFQKHMAPKTG